MILEHEFITTKPQSEVDSLVHQTMADLGFKPKQQSAGHEFVRGKRHPAHAKRPEELPQIVGFAFDRGRVSVGVNLQIHGGERSFHREMLTILAILLENVISKGVPLEMVRGEWDQFHARFARSGRIENAIKRVLLLLAIAGVIALFVILYIGSLE